MDYYEFSSLCGKYLIDVNLALENKELRNTLRKSKARRIETKNAKKIIENILLNEF
jgi:hypothetical protein